MDGPIIFLPLIIASIFTIGIPVGISFLVLRFLKKRNYDKRLRLIALIPILTLACFVNTAIYYMNGLIMNILILASALTACQPAKDSKTENISDTISTEQTSNIVEEDNYKSSSKPKDWQDFESIFTFTDTDGSQKLGVKNLADNSIEFRLLNKDDLCDTEYWGTAKNFYPNGDPETDEDENGEGYFASEYILEDSFKIIKIRIADTNDMAKIKFADKTNTDTDCFPSTVLLKKVNNITKQ